MDYFTGEFPNAIDIRNHPNSQNLAKEIFFNRLNYMMNAMSDDLAAHKKTTYIKNPNAGNEIHIPEVRIKEKVLPARTVIEPDYFIKKSTPQLTQSMIRNIYEVVQSMTALDTGHVFSVDNLYDFINTAQDHTTWGKFDSMISYQGGVGNTKISGKIIDDKYRMQKESLLRKYMERKGHINAADITNFMNVMENGVDFIRFDMYDNGADIGNFGARRLGDEFFDERLYDQMTEALYHYNEGGSGEMKYDVRITNQELEFRDKMLSDDVKLSNEDFRFLSNQLGDTYTDEKIASILMNADGDGTAPRREFRELVVDLRDGITRYEGAIKGDRKTLRDVKGIIEEAKSNGKGIAQVLKEDARYKDLSIAQYVLNHMDEARKTNDSYARHMMRLFLQDANNMRATSVYMDSTVTKDSTRMINQIDSLLADSYNPESDTFAQYHRLRGIKSDYFSMYGSMVEERNIANADGFLYVASDRETKQNGFDIDEYNNMYRESTRLAKVEEENARAYERHVKAIEEFDAEGKDRPKQPVNRFRGAFANALLENDPELAKAEEISMREMMRQSQLNIVESQAELPRLNTQREEAFKQVKEQVAKMEEINRAMMWFQEREPKANVSSEHELPFYRDQLAAKAELDRRQAVVTDIENRIAFHADTIENDGWRNGMGDWTTPEGLSNLKEMLADENTTITYLAEKRVDKRSRDKWYQALEDQERLRLPGSQVAYLPTSIDGNHVTLRKDVELASNATIKVNIDSPEQLDSIIQKLNESAIKSQVDQEVIREMDDRVVQNAFVNIRYKQELVSEDLKAKNEYVFEKLREAEAKIGEMGKAKDGIVEVNVPAADLNNAYSAFRKNLDELDSEGIKKRLSLPKFLLQMAESHAPWMIGDTSKLVSSAELALRQVTNDLAKNNATLDLTDDALEAQWSKYADVDGYGELTEASQTRLAKYSSSLQNKGLSERLDDHLFMRVLSQMIQNHFEDNPTNDSIRSFLQNAHETLEGFNGYRGDGQSVYSLLREDGVKGLFREHGYYAQALKLNADQIEDVLFAQNYSNVYDANFERLNTNFEDQSFGKWDDNEIEGRMYDGDQIQASYLESYNLDPEEVRDNFNEGNYRDIDMNIDDPERAYLLKEQMVSKDPESMMDDVYYRYDNLRKDAVIQRLGEGISVPGVQDIEFMLDMAKETGQDSISGTVRGQEATIFRGSAGDVLAHLKGENVTIQLTDTEVGHTTSVHMNNGFPQKLYGESAIKEDIGDGGAPTRYQYNSYETMQGSGKYTTPTNPSVTIGAMQKFLDGKGTMTYMDIETTGLEGSTLPKNVIQPIEVYMQKVQWDAENNKLLTDADGNYAITHGGRTTTRELQLLTSLSDETKDFMQDVIQNEDFTVQIGKENVHLLDYQAQQGRYDAMIAEAEDAPRIRAEIVHKNDKLWFLRNIAKYAFPGDELSDDQVTRYNQYAGNQSLPSKTGIDPFINQLRADAQKASDILDTVGKANGAIFSDVQVGTTLPGMVKHVSRFVGKGPVAGQNIAKADWSKFMKIAQTELDNATQLFESSSSAMTSKLDTALQTEVRNAVGFFSDYLQSNTDLSQKNQQALRDVVRDIRAGVADESLMKATSLEQFGSALSNMGGSRNERASRMFNRVLQQYGKDPNSVDAIVPYARMNELQQAKTSIANGEKVSFTMKSFNEAYAGDIAAVNKSIDGLASAQKLMQGLPNPAMVEQMFLSQMTNPNLSGNSAEAQFAAAGIEVKSGTGTGLHLAQTDVKNNLELIEHYGKQLADDPGFMDFDNTPLQQGDFLEMHKQVDRNMPIGVYQVDGINGKQMDVSLVSPDGSRQQFTVNGASQADLARKVGTNFSFIGAANADEPVQQTMNRLIEDHARRQMARASDSAFAFDLYQGEMQQIKDSGQLTNEPLRKMQDQYQQVKADTVANIQQRQSNPDLPQNEISSLADRVAVQNAGLFEGDAIAELLDKTATPTKQAAFNLTEQWMNSGEGKRRQSFLNEVRALENTGAIDKNTSRSLIKQWNQAIKQKGFEKGAKHTVFNKSNLGTLDDRFGSMSGTDFVIDRSSPGRVANSLWSMAERTKGMITSEVDEVKAKEAALNQKVIPFLSEQGIIAPIDPANPPRMNSIVQQIMSNPNLKPHEEYDYMKAMELSNDAEYMKFMDDTSNELLQPVRDNLTKLQEAKIGAYEQMRQDLTDQGMYHPALDLKPNMEDVATDTLNFGKYGGLSTYSANELSDIATALEASGDMETRNTIMGELFQQATRGQQVNLDDVIRNGDSNQLRAMEALNWVNNADGVYTPNTDIASHYFGAPGRFAGARMGSLSKEMLDEIAGATTGKYTKGNGLTSVKNKIEGWQARSYEGRYPTAPDNTPPAPRKDTSSRDQLAQANADRKERGSQRRNTSTNSSAPSESLDAINRHVREVVAPDTSYKHTNVISETLTRAKNDAMNWATAMNDAGVGKAAKWIGGLGIAAFALHQFANASSPVKLERKPQGHGVEGATGQTNDGISYGDEGSGVSSPKPSTGGKTYADAGSGGQPPGYRVKVRGDAGGDIDTGQLQKQMNENLGNVNLNMTDNRQTLDRGWLENQFSSYIDRGHVE